MAALAALAAGGFALSAAGESGSINNFHGKDGVNIEFTNAEKSWPDGENGDLVLKFTDTENKGTLTLPGYATAWILSVGGGGAGGTVNQTVTTAGMGGGGGAGGFVELKNQTLQKATYTIEVGKGGLPGAVNTKSQGGNGYASYIYLTTDDVDEQEIEKFTAYGGGGGGAESAGKAGASGGGGSWENKTVRSGGDAIHNELIEQGTTGGKGQHYRASGGGGGAGGPGGDTDGNGANGSGNGGLGKGSFITCAKDVTEPVMYAGGGGGGTASGNPGLGGGSTSYDHGISGGGNGAGGMSGTGKVAENGTDGLGGGGGGGNHKQAGGKGGSGVVIIRISEAMVGGPPRPATSVSTPYTGEGIYGVSPSLGYTISDDVCKTNVGDYTSTVTLKPGFEWEGGGDEVITVNWSITPKPIPYPTPTDFTYDGEKKFVFPSPDPAWQFTPESVTNAVDAGTYDYAATPISDNYKWVDSEEGHERDLYATNWVIHPKPITPPPVPTLTYNGDNQIVLTELNPVWKLTEDSVTNATHAGDYTYTLELISRNYIWDGVGADEEHEPLPVDWVIAPKPVDPPPATTNLVYNGDYQSPIDPDLLETEAYKYTPGCDIEARDALEEGEYYHCVLRLKNDEANDFVWKLEIPNPYADWAFNWEIRQASNDVTRLVLNGWKVHSTPNVPDFDVLWGKNTAVVRYAEAENTPDSEWVSTPPTEVGTWWVWVHVDETINWARSDRKLQFALWDDPNLIFDSSVSIKVSNSANKSFTNYPLTITLNDNVPPGFTYERAGTDGKDLVFISADGQRQFPYKIENWNIAGDSKVIVYLDELPKEGTSVTLYWHLRKDQKTPAQPPIPTNPSATSTYVTSTYDVVKRDGKKVDWWSPAPVMTPDQWDEGTSPTIAVNDYKLASGAPVSAGFYNLYNPAVTNAFDLSAISALTSGVYMAVFYNDSRADAPDDPYENIEAYLTFRVVGHSPTIGLGNSDLGRVLLMNNDTGGDLPAITYQSVFDSDESYYIPDSRKADERGAASSDTLTFWQFIGDDRYEDNTYNRKSGTNCVLWTRNYGRRLWHLTNCRHGNTYNKDDTTRQTGTPKMNANQNYLPWSSTSIRITRGGTFSTRALEVGQILMQNTTNACIYSPCYTNGVGTIYFDAVNGWMHRLTARPNAYDIVVEVATETKEEGIPLTEESSHITTNAVGLAVTNDYSNIKEWVPVTMYPVHYKDGTLTPTNATTKFTLAVRTGATKSDFYRFIVPIHNAVIPSTGKMIDGTKPLRFRIRRAGYDNEIDGYEDARAYLLVDNVLVSYPPMTATLHDLGWFDPEKKNEQTLGRENVTTVAFPSQYEKEAYGRARSTYYVNDGDKSVDTAHMIVSAKMWYRWHYLDQLGYSDSAPFESVDLNPGKSDYRSMQPLKFPGGVGDVDFWFETRFQAPYYSFQDYSGLGLDGKALQKATGFTEEVTCTTNRYRATETQSSAGRDWFFRLREGKSKYEGMQICTVSRQEDASGHISYQIPDPTPMELIGDGSWRGFLKTPEARGRMTFQIVGLNPQEENDGTFTYTTNYWKAIADITALPKTTKAEPCQEQDWAAVPCDARTGYLIFQFEEDSLGLTVAHADYQDFNTWSTAVDPKFVGSALEKAYSSSTVGESNIDWSAWAPSVATDDNWKEDFRVKSGQKAKEIYPKNQPFSSKLSSLNWLAENAMWVHGQWTHETWEATDTEETGPSTIGDDSAVQLEGRGKGRLTFASATLAPKGLDTVKSTMRLAQFNEFNDFNFWDKTTIDWEERTFTYAEDMTDYTFVTLANLSEKGGSDYSGDGTLSLVGYYTLEEGGYEARISRGSKDDTVRIRLLKWQNDGSKMTCTELGYKESTGKYAAQLFTPSRGSKACGLFLSVEKNPNGSGTLVQAGLTSAVQLETAAASSAIKGKQVFSVGYIDTRNPLTHGSFGVLSANCTATFMRPAYYDHGAGKIGDRFPAVANAVVINQTDKSDASELKLSIGNFIDDFPKGTLFADYYKYWKKRPGRLKPLQYSSGVRSGMVGFETVSAFTNRVVLQVAKHGGSEWRSLATNTVSSFLDTPFETVVHDPFECDVRYLMLGGPDDIRTDVVINGVELSQWCGQTSPGLDGSGSYGLYRDFAYTGCWIPERGVLSLQPARASTAGEPISLRSPLLEGVGLVCFKWKNADDAVKVHLQLAEGDRFSTVRSSLAGYTKEGADGDHWTTLATWTRADLKALEDVNGVGSATVCINHRAPKSGALRLIIDRDVVAQAIAGSESRTNPMYGGLQIIGCYVWDLPAYSPRDWSGWNMRAEGWADERPTRFANLFDSPKGYSGILNNTLDTSTLKSENKEHYKQHLPYVQSPTFGTNSTEKALAIGEVLFKARLHDVPRGSKNKAVVTFYGSRAIDPAGEPVSNSWEQVGHVEIDVPTFRTFSMKFPATAAYRAVRFAVNGVAGVSSPGVPLYDPPSRVVIDSLCVFEQAQPSVRFRDLHVRPFRDSGYMKNTKALPESMITSPDEQPLLGESFGFQAELLLEVNEEGDILTDDPKHPISVELQWYAGDEPWGYENWTNMPAAHRVTLAAADGTNLIFRSAMARPESMARPVFKADCPRGYGLTQYHMIARYYNKAGEQLTHELTPNEWTVPEWYCGFADPNEKVGAKFSAYTLLEDISPGRAWINEVNTCESDQGPSIAGQFIELAVPQKIDMRGWEVFVYSLDSALDYGTYEGSGPLFRLGENDCLVKSKDDGDPVSHYAFLAVGAPKATQRADKFSGRWNKLNGVYFAGGTLAYTDPYGFELRRPSGVIEQRVVIEGDSEQYSRYWYGYQYSATNLAAVLNATFPGADWTVAGHDLPVDGKGLSVTNNQGMVAEDWDHWPLTPGEKNRNGDQEQWISPNWFLTPNGEYMWIYLGCLDPQIRMVFDGTNSQSEVITVVSGGGTNITYEVDNFYELDKAKFEESGFVSEHAGHTLTGPKTAPGSDKKYYDLLIYDVSNRVDVTVGAKVAADIEARGVTDDNPYKPAIMKWLRDGFTRDANGRAVPFAGDTVHDFLYRISNGTTPTEETTNLPLTVAYWLDVDVTEPGWELRGNMGAFVPGALGQEAGSYPCHLDTPAGRVVHTNRIATLWTMLTNTVRTVENPAKYAPLAHPPWRLQGLGNERSDDLSSYAQGWTSVTFKVKGRLMKSEYDPLMKTPRSLRYFVFDKKSFRPQDDSLSPFSARVEVVDPFSAQSPASDWNWSPWWRLTVGLSWGLDDSLTPAGVSVMRFDDRVDEDWEPGE